jgi:ABC-type Fe3+ transport system substrate-binding protein
MPTANRPTDPSPPASVRPRRRVALLAITIVLLAGLVACGPQTGAQAPTPAATASPLPRPTAEPPAAVGAWYAAAQAEESVRVRVDLTPAEVERLTGAIARRYPRIQVEWRRVADAELLQATLAEARASSPAWDVYVGDSGPALKSARLALHWSPPEARGVPPELIDAEGAWYALAATYHVVQYNTEQVPPSAPPTTYEALRDPRFVGRLAIEDLNLTWLRGLVETRGRDAAATLIRGLAQQAVTFRPDARALVVFVTSGAQAVAIDSRLDVVQRERWGGGKTAWVGVEPVIVQPLAMVVSATTDRPNGARLVANFLLSQDAQSILVEFGRVPSRPDVDQDPASPTRTLKTRVTLPPEGASERELRDLWLEWWGRR